MRRAIALEKFIQSYPAQFEWSSNNCCHFANAWVKSVEGRDALAGLPQLGDRRSTLRTLVRLFGTLEFAVSRQLGREPVPVSLAQVGDLVLIRHEEVKALAICAGRTAVMLSEDEGIVHALMDYAVCAWRVEFT